MKKARAWLDQHGVAYDFHDYKTAGIERDRLERWSKKVGWETLLNRAGTTFKKLPDKDKHDLTEKKAVALMLAGITSALYMWRGTDSPISVGLGNTALIASFACCWQGARAFDRRRPLWS